MNDKQLQQWDWPLLYYIGTVILNMTEEEFWKCTPRKLFALLKVQGEVNNNPVQQQNKITDPTLAVKQFIRW
jgi:uncharacterized phage protein (TIGR02216 family)